MGKVKINLYCYITADILTNNLRPRVVLYQAYHFCPNLWIWLVAMATKKLNLKNNIKKSSTCTLKAFGDKAETFAEMFITLASTKMVFLLSLLMCFRCYGNLKFPLTYNGKIENWHLLLSHRRYFDKSFSEIFVEWSSTKYVQTS